MATVPDMVVTVDAKQAAEDLAKLARSHAPGETMDAMMGRLATRVQPATIVDVGSSNGCWSEMARRHWPAAKLLCIEADARHWPALEVFAARTGAHVVRAMAGDHVGVGNFAASPTDPFGGTGRVDALPDTKPTNCTTVDHEVERLALPAPFLLKLDTHGFEPWILNGAANVLRGACALVIEAYTCTLQPGAFRFWELCRYLEERGFLPTDMADPMWRPLDGRLWQTDLAFERADVPQVGEGRYR